MDVWGGDSRGGEQTLGEASGFKQDADNAQILVLKELKKKRADIGLKQFEKNTQILIENNFNNIAQCVVAISSK